MRRHRLFRMIALPLGLWFVARATDVRGIDACPMHDAMGHGMSAAAMGQMAGAHGMTSMPAAPPAPNAPPAPPHGPMPCTCMGACCGCATATVPTAPATPVPAALAVHQSVPVACSLGQFVAAPRHLLPPALGPPAVLTV